MNIRKRSYALCRFCNKETYNETSDWSGFCSKRCEERIEYSPLGRISKSLDDPTTGRILKKLGGMRR